LAYSGEQALSILTQDTTFELVITDMQMPDMDGVSLALEITKINPKLSIILLSSIGNEQRERYEHLFSHILTKPVKQKILSNAITHELRKLAKTTPTVELPTAKLSADFATHFPLNILIAEDNPVNQMLAIRTLKKLGYEAKLAENGVLALEETQRLPYDIILMDVQMPEMDGLEATRLIRKSNNTQPVIIAMTANALAEDKEACFNAGMDDYISKPIRLDEVIKTLEKWALFLHNKKKQLP
jgi:CheY-like chemotaxis protein